MSEARTPKESKAQEILDVAQELIQTRGYNGFSYRDIADEIGIKSASIHYHFPAKGQLGRAVTAQYTDAFMEALRGLEADPEIQRGGVRSLLEGYINLYRMTLVEGGKLCLCGMLAGETQTVPDEVKTEVARFFVEQRQWLAQVIASGISEGSVTMGVSASGESMAMAWATTILSALEGAMFVAKGLGDYDQFDVAAAHLLRSLFVETR